MAWHPGNARDDDDRAGSFQLNGGNVSLRKEASFGLYYRLGLGVTKYLRASASLARPSVQLSHAIGGHLAADRASLRGIWPAYAFACEKGKDGTKSKTAIFTCIDQ